MGDQDHRVALPVQLLQNAQHLAAGMAVQGAGGLVGQDDRRPPCQGPGNGGALLLAARELAGLVVQLVPQAHLLEGRPGAGLLLFAGQPGVDQGQLHVFHQAELGQKVVLLEDEAQHLVADLGQFVLAHAAHVPAVEPVGAGSGHVQAADDVHAGGLARAGLAHDGHELALVDLHRDVVHRLDGGVAHLVVLADVVKFNECAHPQPPATVTAMPGSEL